MGFEVVVPLASLMLSLVAIVYTVRESKRNNAVLAQVVECKAMGRQYFNENRGQPFDEFNLKVRNLGLSLHDPQMAIVFRDKRGVSTVTVPLNRRSRTKAELSEFGRGMIAEFGLKSYEIEPHHLPMLLMLEDVAKQEASLCLYSQGYTAVVFKLWGFRSDWLRSWNFWAFSYNRLFDEQMEGNVLKPGNVVRDDYPDPGAKLSFFIQSLRHPERWTQNAPSGVSVR